MTKNHKTFIIDRPSDQKSFESPEVTTLQTSSGNLPVDLFNASQSDQRAITHELSRCEAYHDIDSQVSNYLTSGRLSWGERSALKEARLQIQKESAGYTIKIARVQHKRNYQKMVITETLAHVRDIHQALGIMGVCFVSFLAATKTIFSMAQDINDSAHKHLKEGSILRDEWDALFTKFVRGYSQLGQSTMHYLLQPERLGISKKELKKLLSNSSSQIANLLQS